MFKVDKSQDTALFIMGWGIVGAFLLFMLFNFFTEGKVLKYMPPCVMYQAFGIYCPGCGGTRAVKALLAGHPLWSLYFHPFVLYATVGGGCFLVSQTIERVSRGKIKIALHFRPVYLYICLALIAINFIVKNVALLAFHLPMLGQ